MDDLRPDPAATHRRLTRKGLLVIAGQRVLVVDQVSDTADVLRAVLEPQGVAVDAHRRPGPRSETKPSVVVIDAEQHSPAALAAGSWADIPQIILGTLRIDDPSPDAGREILRKPFHFAELISAIERLIARRAA